jgi:hypothetical protein
MKPAAYSNAQALLPFRPPVNDRPAPMPAGVRVQLLALRAAIAAGALPAKGKP